MYGSAPLLIFYDFQPRTKPKEALPNGLWNHGIITCRLKISLPFPLSRSEQRLGAGVLALALVGSLLPGRFHHFEHFFRWTGFLLWSRFLRHTQVSHRPNHFAISGFQTHNQTAHSTKIEGATGFWRTIPVSACRAVCFIRAKKVRPANWYGSKGRVSEGGAALNALGSLAFLARPLVNHWTK